MSYRALQSELGRLLHREPWETRHVPKSLAKAGAWIQNRLGSTFIRPWMIDLADHHYELDISRAADLLGWEPAHRLRATLPAMAASLKQNSERWYRLNGLSAPEGRRVG